MRPPEGPLALRELDPLADPRWDAYVAAHPGGLVYHRSGWLRALQRESGGALVALALEDDRGALHGVLPLMATSGLPFGRGGELAGRRRASLPRTPVAGPIAGDREGMARLVAGARARLAPDARLQLKVADTRLDGIDPALHGRPWRLSYVRELPPAGEALRFGTRRNHVRIRSAVRTSARDGVTVRRATGAGDVRAWYRLYLGTMRLHLVPPRPWRLFAALWEDLAPRGEMRLLLAERGGELLAGSLLLMSGSTVFYAFNGSRPEALALKPNDALQWRALHDAWGEGYARYDLGEVAEGHAGLAHFKRKWGADARRLHRYTYPAPSAAPAAPDGAAPALARRAWRRVPLGATAMAGRLVHRYL
jgi:hypothetical protein